MIVLDNVHKGYVTHLGTKKVLRGISATIPREMSLGILGRNGAGKSTLIRILSGLDIPDVGTIDHGGLHVSWPIGRGGMNSKLTGRDNVRFVARIYGMDIDAMMQSVEEFAELGEYIDMPVTTYSSGMRSRLAFAISMASDYDTYLVDEGFSAGDARFTQRMQALFDQRRERANMIVVSHSLGVIKRFCNQIAVLHEGQLIFCETVKEAMRLYKMP